MLRLSESAPASEVEAARQKLEQVHAKIVDGTFSCEEAARSYGEDNTAEFGGDLSWVVRGDLDLQVENAIFGLAERELSTPVRTSFGWHLFKVVGVGRRPIVPN